MRRFWAIIILVLMVAVVAGNAILILKAFNDKDKWNAAHMEIGTVEYALHDGDGLLSEHNIVVKFADGTRTTYSDYQYMNVLVGDEIMVAKEKWNKWPIVVLSIIGLNIGCTIVITFAWSRIVKDLAKENSCDLRDQ